MVARTLAAFVTAFLLTMQGVPSPAYADNPMGHRLLSAQEASGLPRNRGVLGLDVERAQRITDGDVTFDVMRVEQVRRNSPGARAGSAVGDQIIAVDGRVFPTIATFAAYVGSVRPGSQISIDYMPSGAGSQEAQRVAVTVGAAGEAPASTGMSTGTKVAIGAGAAALLCYKFGCFSHRPAAGVPNDGQQQPQGPNGLQQR